MLGLFRSRKNKNVTLPRLPDGVRIYAMGDIHGRSDLLREMFSLIDEDIAQNPVSRPIEIFLGDYIDRGPDSAETLDLLIDRSRSRRRETVFLKGNHEAYFLELLRDSTKLNDWRQFGGIPTLMSYGIQPTLNPDTEEQAELIGALIEAVPDEHIAFLQRLKPSFACGDFFFVHAGVRFGIPLNEQREADLLWIRSEFLESSKDFGKFIVHGHTPVPAPDLRSNRINIDTGAYATGKLTLLAIEGSTLLGALTGSSDSPTFRNLREND
jgi:serine/threonine protein phosphatase 1